MPVHLGRYRIRIDLESRVFPGSIKVTRVLTAGADDTTHEYWHPHIGRGYFCWGSFAVPAETALHEGQADFLVSILLQHLATANMSSYMTPTYNFMYGRPYHVEPLPMASPRKPARR